MSDPVFIVNRGQTAVVCECCLVADTPLARLRGLLGREKLSTGHGLLLRPAPAIHTWFMSFPIDAVFLDRDFCVIGIAEALKPWRSASRRRARAVLELPAGEAAKQRLRTGDQLAIVQLDAAGRPVRSAAAPAIGEAGGAGA